MHGLFALGSLNAANAGPFARAFSSTTASGLKTATLAELLSIAGQRPMIDGFNRPEYVVNYKEILKRELEKLDHSPLTTSGGRINFAGAGLKTPEVAVIGGGMSGLLTSLQLIKAGFKVRLFESRGEPDVSSDVSQAGRIFTANSVSGDPTTSVELGAMRFPARSYLFWHYAKYSGLLKDNSTLTQFPNPSEVPSAFRSQGTTYGIWKADSTLSLSASDKALQKRQLDMFGEYVPYGDWVTANDIKSYIAGGQSPYSVHRWWRLTCADLYGLSYRQLLERSGFSTAEIARIGYLGLGTGGFAPLFGVSALEIMRLYMWDYADEYAVPNLRAFPCALLQQLRKLSTTYNPSLPQDTFSTYYYTTVERIYYSGKYQNYRVEARNPKELLRIGFDYVVMAMTHPASEAMLLRSAQDVGGDIRYTVDDLWAPYLDARLTKGPIARGLSDASMMQSVKYFHTMPGPAHSKIAGHAYTYTSNTNSKKAVRCLYGESDIGAPGYPTTGITYVLPTGGAWAENFDTQTKAIGLHYSWGEESINFANKLRDYIDLSHGFVLQKVSGNESAFAMPSNFVQAGVSGRLSYNNSNFYFTPGYPSIFSHSYNDEQMYRLPMTRVVVEWGKVPQVWGGFKLDLPGKGVHLTYSYRVLSYAVRSATRVSDWSNAPTTTWDPFYGVHPSSKRCYFAGDSFSHYGGWVEGAFQSAINVAAGIVRAHIADYPSLSNNFYGHMKKDVCDMLLYGACDPYTYSNGNYRRS